MFDWCGKKIKYKAVNQETNGCLRIVNKRMSKNLPDMKAVNFKRVKLENRNEWNFYPVFT